MKHAFLATAALVAISAAAFAQHDAHDAPSADPATAAYAAANQAMMEGTMQTPATGDPDKDFALLMIPHHEGAVAMAKVVLEYGDDPEIRKLAEAILRTQAEEIRWMEEWLAKQPD